MLLEQSPEKVEKITPQSLFTLRGEEPALAENQQQTSLFP